MKLGAREQGGMGAREHGAWQSNYGKMSTCEITTPKWVEPKKMLVLLSICALALSKVINCDHIDYSSYRFKFLTIRNSLPLTVDYLIERGLPRMRRIYADKKSEYILDFLSV